MRQSFLSHLRHEDPGSSHVAPHRFNIMDDSIRIAGTTEVLFDLSHSSFRGNVIEISRGSNVLATISVHGSIERTLDLVMNGRSTKIKAGGDLYPYWTYTSPMSRSGSFWWYGKDESEESGLSVSLEEAKTFLLQDTKQQGDTIATLRGNVLTIEVSMDPALVDEIVISTIGILQLQEQQRKDNKAALKVFKTALGF